MQILCGLQVVFFLFNCQTPVHNFSFMKTLFLRAFSVVVSVMAQHFIQRFSPYYVVSN